MNTPEFVKKELSDNYKFWAGVMHVLDDSLRRNVNPSEVVDFDVFVSDENDRTIHVVVYYNSNKNYDLLHFLEDYLDHKIDVIFKRNNA